jgi:hypothetical protein
MSCSREHFEMFMKNWAEILISDQNILFMSLTEKLNYRLGITIFLVNIYNKL